ncbi:MAG: hypothetical protein Q9P01_01865 [Anaerolineae bacterium]|nr:hypothetical protein [Anaerolineae bacterium]
MDGVTYVGRKIPNWDYQQNATRKALDSGQGFEYHDFSGMA